MHGSHNPFLVVLSIVLAVLASYTALDLAGRVAVAAGRQRNAWVGGGGLAMGFGIWSMHFTAMLAYNLPVPIRYHWGLTALSLGIAIGVSGVALWITGRERVSPAALLGAGLGLGVAIAGMHYTGMAAVRVPGALRYEILLVGASVMIALVAAVAALWLLLHFRFMEGIRAFWGKAASAGVMGVAITGLHYTGMAGVTFVPAPGAVSFAAGDLLARSELAVGVVVGTLVILALARLAIMAHRDVRPIQLMTGTAVLAGLLFALLGWAVWGMYEAFRQLESEVFTQQRQIDRVDFLDEALTMSSRMAAASGNLEWEARYRRLDAELAIQLPEILRWAEAAAPGATAVRLKAASDTLLALENQAFALVHEGRREEALALLESPQYTRPKRGYLTASATIRSAVSERIAEESDEFRRRAILVGLLATVILAALALAGAFLRRTMFAYAAQRNRDEAALRESQRAMNSLLGNLTGMAYRCRVDDNRTLEFASEGALKLTGYTPAQLIGKGTVPYGGLIHADDEQRVLDGMWIALQENRPFQMEYRIHTAQGEEKCVWEQGQGVFSPEGELLFTEGFITDITDRKRAEEELAQVSARNTLILESAAEGIYVLDINGCGTFANPAAAALLGYTMEELIGKPQHALIHHTRPDGTPNPAEECPVYHTLRDGEVRHVMDEVYWRKDGTSLPVEYTSTPKKEGNKIIGAVVTFRDVSERREVERMKDEFISVVSHELRTPLTSIRGSLGLLAGGLLGDLPERGKHLLNIAVQNTDRLVRLINDILDIERMESGEVRMETRACEVAELMKQTGELLHPVADKAAVQLSITPLPARIQADADRIIQVLTNLLSNAIKFSSPGSKVSLTAAQQDGSVLFSVRDQGRGIPTAQLETIFGRFQQLDASDAREKGGTGLGLAISRSIVQQHGGRIWAESTVGEGSTFHVTLPLVREEPLLAPAPESRRPLVLVCDDDPSIREVVGGVLEQKGYRVLTAATGAEAIEVAAAEQPSTILLDLIMPGLSGRETISALKANPATREIPVIILSGLRPVEDEAVNASADDWVTKPFDEESLFAIVERAVNGHARTARILVVEDDHDLAQVITTTFRTRGIETHHARTGREAIDLSQKVDPHLIILDLVLPEGDGYTVVDWLRRHNALRNVPLVVYSVKEPSAEEREHLKLGRTEFLTKGRLAPEEFERRVIDLLDHVIPNQKKETTDREHEESADHRG